MLLTFYFNTRENAKMTTYIKTLKKSMVECFKDIILISFCFSMVSLFCVFSYLYQEYFLTMAEGFFSYITQNFSWTFMLYGFISLLLLIWLASSNLGKIKLSSNGEGPEFSYFSWISLLFCAGIGIGIIIWGVVEPLYYLNSLPSYAHSSNALASEWAHMIPLFHWGVNAWAIYCLPTIPVAYCFYVKRYPGLTISSCFNFLNGGSETSWFRKLIDIIVIFALLGGVATSHGFAIPVIAKFFAYLFGMETSLTLEIFTLCLLTLVFGLSVSSGLSKGLKKLSLFNAYLAILFILFVLFCGPTSFILSITTNSIGLLFDNFFRMSLALDPVGQSGWPQKWTVFYWGWWLAYTPLMATFVCCISKGRTIRELIIAQCIWGTLGCWFVLSVLGGFSLYGEIFGTLSVSKLLLDNNLAQASLEVFKTLPLSGLVISLYLVLAFVFCATTLDSCAYTLSSFSDIKEKKSREPVLALRLIWTLVLFLVSLGVLLMESFRAIQLTSMLVAIPLIPITLLMFFKFIKRARNDQKIHLL